MRLPRDLVEEIEKELDSTHGVVPADKERAAELTELHARAVALGTSLGRPITIFDLVRSARTEAERASLDRLLRQLRRRASSMPGAPGTREERS